MKLWITMAVAGALLGAVAGLEPWNRFGGGDAAPIPGLTSTTRAEQLKELERLRIEGIRLVTEKKYREAVAVFLKLNYVNHHDPFSYQQLAMVVARAGADEAEKLVKKEMSPRPNAADTERILGGMFFYAKADDRAVKHLDVYLAANPDDPAAMYYTGAITRKKGDNKEAIRVLSKVVEKEPGHYYAYVELQQAYEAMGNDAQAAKMLGLALKNSPSNKEGVCCGLPPDKKATEKGKKT
ncbi:MAG: tetratricopeptide repeat protein [Nitrospinae bacterium]|nr:tetratricopeptide repeat protein [Nitrospinota bacterium]